MAVTTQVISFARGVPAPECLPVEELAECARAVLERDGRTILSYGSGAGYTPLRSLIGEWFGVHPSRVVLTNGSLNGFLLLAQRLARGQNAFIEYPTYDRAIKILLSSGATIPAVAVDDEGIVPEDLENQLRQTPSPAFLYTIPTFQNPTGRTMSAARRERVVAIAQAMNVPIFEDDPYSLIRFEGEPLPALFDLTGKQSIYSSSFSKTISPGLRVGFFVLPEALAEEITEAATSTYITPVLLAQATVHEFITRGLFEPNLRRVNELIKARRDAMLGALEKHFSGATWTRPEGGYFVWLELPVGTNAKEVIDRAEGVTAVPGPEFGGAAHALRLAYSFASPEEIEVGIERLAAAV
ncbi:MAG TPA: PLP-dependent aminotransferase family protein [Gaiellaceae bacterium]|nr:PLP-dependent aminotransferase family protein [Gaiellaceae bacterium]